MIGQTAEQWLAERLSAGPRQARGLIATGQRIGYLREDVVGAAEMLGVIRLRDKNKHPVWYVRPEDPHAGRRLLAALECGHHRGLRDHTRSRVIADAMAAAQLGRCEECCEVRPLSGLGEDSLCRACSTVAAS